MPFIPDGLILASYRPAFPKIWSNTSFSFSLKFIFVFVHLNGQTFRYQNQHLTNEGFVTATKVMRASKNSIDSVLPICHLFTDDCKIKDVTLELLSFLAPRNFHLPSYRAADTTNYFYKLIVKAQQYLLSRTAA